MKQKIFLKTYENTTATVIDSEAEEETLVNELMKETQDDNIVEVIAYFQIYFLLCFYRIVRGGGEF